MNHAQRFRPGTPNPHRYQGSLRHYHVAPPRREVSWEQWVGESARVRRKRTMMVTAATCIGLAATIAALWP